MYHRAGEPSISRREHNGSNNGYASSPSSASPTQMSLAKPAATATLPTLSPSDGDQSARAKAVVRAACLACRTAKRRCDGAQPVCGPCSTRGVTQDSGTCAYVASKRGGPRFKGCTGEQARKIKAEKDKQRAQRGPSKAKLETEPRVYSVSARKSSPSDSGYSGEADGDGIHSGSGSGSGFIPRGRFDELSLSSSSTTPIGQGLSPTGLTGLATSHASHSPTSSQYPYRHPQYHQYNSYPHQDTSRSRGRPELSGSRVPNTHETDGSPEGQHDALSAANIAVWQKQQEIQPSHATHREDRDESMELDHEFSFENFYSRLETLPKAGNVGSVYATDVAIAEWDSTYADLLDAADSEQQARFLLTYFFEKVYSSAPVLLGPENLSSLAFWFSGKGPCALYAAIGALVSLRLPEHEAHRTLRGGYANQHSPNASMSRAEVAAQHARTSSFLLKRFSQQQAAAAAGTFGLNPNAVAGECNADEFGRSLCQGPSDPELLRIEAAAAHTLLAHYHYGAGGHASQKVAHEHALEAWTSLQGIRFDLKEGLSPTDPLGTSHFSWDQKQEWAKRVYWTSFAATAVTACTGGFAPVLGICDPVTALKLRPALEGDVGAWGVFIRGAQHVSRGYSAIHAFEMLKQRKNLSAEEIARQKVLIFSEYSKLDRDMSSFTTYDPAWRSPPEGIESSRFGNNELGFALRTAGKLMTAGATIILHRGQAYANANIFLDPQCGLPQASRTSAQQQSKSAQHALYGETAGSQEASGFEKNGRAGPPRSPSPSDQYVTPDRLWHRSGSVTLPPPGSGSRGSGSDGGTACKPVAFDPQLAALDANFIHYPLNTSSNGQWMAGSGQANHQHPQSASHHTHAHLHAHGHAPTAHSFSGNGATDVAMAAFQHFQSQQPPVPRHDGCSIHPMGILEIGDAFQLHQQDRQEQDPQRQSTSLSLTNGTSSGERYKLGPFEAEYSMEKCRWAADAMLESVSALLGGGDDPNYINPLGNHFDEAPSLPPWAACSYVLAGYCLLMQCLIVQASRAWRHSSNNSTPEALSNGGPGDELDDELRRLRKQVLSIHDLLARFALTFNIAKEYKKEVAVLLEVNRKLK